MVVRNDLDRYHLVMDVTAMETAAILAEPHGLPVAARATLREIGTVTGRG